MTGARNLWAAAAAAGALTACGAARAADAIPYPSPGVYNSTLYSFTAAADGQVTGYIVGGFGAGFENEVGLLINGTLSASGYGLNNHATAEGDAFDFGTVQAGDLLTFVMHNVSLDAFVYSDASLNGAYDNANYSAGHNHVYSTAYTATDPSFAGVPLGVYLAFEDLPFDADSDFNYDNYDDESFVFTNTLATGATVPEPGTWGLLIVGFSAVGGMARAWRGTARQLEGRGGPTARGR